MFLVNQKEIKFLRQHRWKQTLHMVQRSCLARHRLFIRCCTLNTRKSNRGAKMTFIRAEWWGAGCRWARTWEHPALTLLVCQEPWNPGVLPARAVPATYWDWQWLLWGSEESWGIFPSFQFGRPFPFHWDQRRGSHPFSCCPSTPVPRGTSSAVRWGGSKHCVMGFSRGPAEISHHCGSCLGAAGKSGVPSDTIFSCY